MPVNTIHASYDKRIKAWAVMRDVIAGHDAIQARGEAYLPKLSEQTDEEYQAYKGRATFFNATGRVVDALTGMLLRKAPTVADGKTLSALLADVTLTGVPFAQLAQDVVQEQLIVTRAGILVDHPVVQTVDGRTVTLAIAERLGHRAYARLYHAEDIVNWRTRRRGGRTVVDRVVLREQETAQDPDDAFAVTTTEIYRVLQLDEVGLYLQQVWRQSDKTWVPDAPVFPLIDGKRLDEIPFEFFGVRGNEPEPDQPVLYDLAVVNLSHYRKKADHEHGLHFTGLPTATISGVADTDTVYTIGSAKAWVFSNPQAKASYLEFTGQGLSALRDALKDDESQMAALGARMLAPEKRAVEAAETVVNMRQGETSSLASIGNAASRGLSRVLGWMAAWEGLKADTTVVINTDFDPSAMTPQFITAMLNAVTTGNLSARTFYETLVNGEAIAGARTFEEEQALIGEAANDNPPPAPAREAPVSEAA